MASFGEFAPFVDLTYKYFKEITMDKMSFPYVFRTPEYWTDEYVNWEIQDRSKEKRENSWITIYGGNVRGRVMGGNLNTIQGIWGSKYMPEIKDGDILFIEDSLKDVATIERSFSFLKLNGVFDKISGIILGKHELFDDMKTGRKPYEILVEVLGDNKLPFIADFDCCHTMIMYNMDKKVDYDKLKTLFNEVGWNDKTEDNNRLLLMVENSQIVVTAWDEGRMVGFARCTTDYVFNGQINNVVVDSKYRKKGIGKNLINIIFNSSQQVTYMLRGSISNEGFYRSLGFEDGPISLIYKRKR